MGAELDQHQRAQRAHQPVRERDVAEPGAERAGAGIAPEQRRQRRIGQRVQPAGLFALLWVEAGVGAQQAAAPFGQSGQDRSSAAAAAIVLGAGVAG
jgi:hypothetical protein